MPSLMAARSDPDALVLLAPSEHAIGDDVSFAESVRLGAEAARDGFVDGEFGTTSGHSRC